MKRVMKGISNALTIILFLLLIMMIFIVISSKHPEESHKYLETNSKLSYQDQWNPPLKQAQL